MHIGPWKDLVLRSCCSVFLFIFQPGLYHKMLGRKPFRCNEVGGNSSMVIVKGHRRAVMPTQCLRDITVCFPPKKIVIRGAYKKNYKSTVQENKPTYSIKRTQNGTTFGVHKSRQPILKHSTCPIACRYTWNINHVSPRAVCMVKEPLTPPPTYHCMWN